MDLPDVAAVCALAPADQQAVIEAAFVRTWNEADGFTSHAGRGLWFAAWRAWVDDYTARVPDQAAQRFTHAALDYFESQIEQQETAGRN